MGYHQFLQLVERCAGGYKFCFDFPLGNILDSLFSQHLSSMIFISHLNEGLCHLPNLIHELLPFKAMCLLLSTFFYAFCSQNSFCSSFSLLVSTSAPNLTALAFPSMAFALSLARRTEAGQEGTLVGFLVFADDQTCCKAIRYRAVVDEIVSPAHYNFCITAARLLAPFGSSSSTTSRRYSISSAV